MAKEYLVVLFPRPRKVRINGAPMGQTNTVLELDGGDYDVALGPPANFTPPQQRVTLRNTSAMMPMTVAFEVLP